MKVFITGGTGLIGTYLIKKLSERGDEITVLTRNKEKACEKFPDSIKIVEGVPVEPGQWQEHIEGNDAVINLAGEPVISARWTKAEKERVYNSRIKTTENIVTAINNASDKPEVLINSSAVGFYGLQKDDRELAEDEISGKDFLSHVCMDWEDTARKAEKSGVRVIRLRTGIVLTENGGALEKMTIPFKMYAGGYVGSGKQWLSWIHIDDMVGIILFALDNKNIKGAVNATAPYPLKMSEFSEIIGKVLHRPVWANVPKIAVQAAMGEVAETLTEGQRVIPSKIMEAGYEFEFSEAETALENLLER